MLFVNEVQCARLAGVLYMIAILVMVCIIIYLRVLCVQCINNYERFLARFRAGSSAGQDTRADSRALEPEAIRDT